MKFGGTCRGGRVLGDVFGTHEVTSLESEHTQLVPVLGQATLCQVSTSTLVSAGETPQEEGLP